MDTDNTQTENATRQLRRPSDDRVVAGVASGIARYLDIPPIVVRVAFVAASLAGGGGFLAYVVAYFLMPEDHKRPDTVQREPSRRTGWLPYALVAIGVL